jgi:NAD(P)-dependent dehydrogenase (short-subunit alcohol dehydrogenase family)
MSVAVAARTADQVEGTADLIRSEGGQALAIPTDVTDQARVQRMVDTVEAELGPIDLLVNSAGAGPPFGPTWEVEPSEWWQTVETNLMGPMLCCSTAIRRMTARSRGRIINVASGAGTICIPYMSAYVTSKAALIRLTEVLAEEVRKHGISVFAIQPGTVRTAMAEELMQSEEGRLWLPWFKQTFDEGRDDSPESAVELVLYLASGQADSLSGRYFEAPGAPEEIARRADEIRDRDLQVLRMKRIE